MSKKILQVPVIVGEGEGQFFIEKDICISPPSPPVFKIKDVKEWVEIYTWKVIPGKIIFNAFLWKDITYKTVEHVHDETVNGPIYHATTKLPFGGFVEICPYPGEKVCENACAELLEAKVEGKKDIWHGEHEICGQKVYKKVLEKSVVKVKFKVTRTQHVPVKVEWKGDLHDGKDKAAWDKDGDFWDDNSPEEPDYKD
jgi:hypothetical protein